MSNLLKRIITGLIFGVVVIALLSFNNWTFLAFTTVVFGVCYWEYINITFKESEKKYKYLALVFYGFVILIASMVYLTNTMLVYGLAAFYLCVLLSIVLFTLLDVFNKGKSIAPFISQAFILFVIPAMLLLIISSTTIDNKLILALLIVTWSNDVGAYLIGKFFGKHKLIERISPNKTWEGAIGGFVFSILAIFLLDYFYCDFKIDNILYLGLLGGLLSIFAIIGDLYQSKVKREYKIKDSGKILPGHGGMWDRFDGFIFVVYGYFFFYFGPLVLELFNSAIE